MNRIDNKYIVSILTVLSMSAVYLANYLSTLMFRVMFSGRIMSLTYGYFIAFSSAYFGASLLWIFSGKEKGYRPFKIALISSAVFSTGKLIIFFSMMITMFMPMGHLGMYAPFTIAGILLIITSFVSYLFAKISCKTPSEKSKSLLSRAKFLIVLTGIWVILITYIFVGRDSNYPIGQKPETVGRVYLDLKDTTLNLFYNQTNKELLLRHFASSLDWKVGRFNGNFRIDRAPLCAVKKNKKGLSYETTLNGYIDNPTENVERADIYLRFEEYENKWKTPEYEAGTDKAELKVDSGKYSGGKYHSAVLIKGKGIDLYITESGKDKKRRFTQKTVDEINILLKNLLNSDAVKEKGYDQELMSRGSVIRSKEPELALIGSSGYYNITGYINPGEKGYIYSKAYNPDTKKDMINEYFHSSSIEYIGWSDDPEEKFSFDIETFIQSSTFKQKAVVEIWFHSLEKKCEDRLMVSKESELTAFRR